MTLMTFRKHPIRMQIQRPEIIQRLVGKKISICSLIVCTSASFQHSIKYTLMRCMTNCNLQIPGFFFDSQIYLIIKDNK